MSLRAYRETMFVSEPVGDEVRQLFRIGESRFSLSRLLESPKSRHVRRLAQQAMLRSRRDRELAKFRTMSPEGQLEGMLDLAEDIRFAMTVRGQKPVSLGEYPLTRSLLISEASCRIDLQTLELLTDDDRRPAARTIRLCHEMIEPGSHVFTLTNRLENGEMPARDPIVIPLTSSLVDDRYAERRVKYLTMLEVLAEQTIPPENLLASGAAEYL